jgi:hypothetical protein
MLLGKNPNRYFLHWRVWPKDFKGTNFNCMTHSVYGCRFLRLPVLIFCKGLMGTSHVICVIAIVSEVSPRR